MKTLYFAEILRIMKQRSTRFGMVFLIGAACFLAGKEYSVLRQYKNLEPFLAPQLMTYVYLFGFAVLTGMTLGTDFKTRRVGNLIARGVSRKKYYFSRLFGQITLYIVFFVVSVLLYTIFHKAFGNSDPQWTKDLYFEMLFCYMGVLLLQMIALGAFFTMLSFLVKNGAVAIGIGAGLVYGELLLEQLAKHFGIEPLEKVLHSTPYWVLNHSAVYVIQNRVLTEEFLLKSISAILILLVTSYIGMQSFCCSDLK